MGLEGEKSGGLHSPRTRRELFAGRLSPPRWGLSHHGWARKRRRVRHRLSHPKSDSRCVDQLCLRRRCPCGDDEREKEEKPASEGGGACESPTGRRRRRVEQPQALARSQGALQQREREIHRRPAVRNGIRVADCVWTSYGTSTVRNFVFKNHTLLRLLARQRVRHSTHQDHVQVELTPLLVSRSQLGRVRPVGQCSETGKGRGASLRREHITALRTHS